ncbi:MAG: hypothetical protein F6K09_07090 [Merismopedia sp. SIO2A8]|nr:hypothetical protein [Symploca sp. SIO2B6]NET48483.1 hypothetical protein [Merismopedia sp. SIO2A8]
MYFREDHFDKLGFADIKGLRPNIWRKLTDEQRVFTLQECASRIALFEKRPFNKVEIFDFKQLKGEDKNFNIAYHPPSKNILIAPEYISKPSPYNVFASLVYCSREAYRTHILNNQELHKNELERQELCCFKSYEHLKSQFKQFGEYCKNLLKQEHGLKRSQKELDYRAKYAFLGENKKSRRQRVIEKKEQVSYKFEHRGSSLYRITNLETGKSKNRHIIIHDGKSIQETLEIRPNLLKKSYQAGRFSTYQVKLFDTDKQRNERDRQQSHQPRSQQRNKERDFER